MFSLCKSCIPLKKKEKHTHYLYWNMLVKQALPFTCYVLSNIGDELAKPRVQASCNE